MQKITTHLWFNDQAEEASQFYVSLFKNSKIKEIARYGDAGAEVSGRPNGSVMTVAFELDGQEFIALNGGPLFKFTEAMSLLVHCESQQEVDHLWREFSKGGEIQQCGWLKDRYGVSWQIVPTILQKLMQGEDSEKTARMMAAMLQMKKLDIAALQQAYDNT